LSISSVAVRGETEEDSLPEEELRMVSEAEWVFFTGYGVEICQSKLKITVLLQCITNIIENTILTTHCSQNVTPWITHRVYYVCHSNILISFSNTLCLWSVIFLKSICFWDMTPCSALSGTTQRTTQRHIPEADTLQNHRCENLKSYM
jgi:hypothetical protein